jgi:3-dehydroquinate synthase
MPIKASGKSANVLSVTSTIKKTQEVIASPLPKLAMKTVEAAAPNAAKELEGRVPVLLIDKRVNTLWEAAINDSPMFKDTQHLLLPIGEAAKTLPTVETTLRSLARMGATRNDNYIVAIGGGGLLDAAGFIANIFHRGLPLVHIPTTLLAMMDATLGGKNGVNFLGNKNQVGSFYLPSLSVLDFAFMDTLAEEHLRNGLIEAVKMTFLAGPKELGALTDNIPKVLDGDKEATEKVVLQALRIKSSFISDDLYDMGKRQHLNFGHTSGHSIEANYGGRIAHGDAVASGMLIALEISRELGMLSKGTEVALADALAACGFQLQQVMDPTHLAHLLWGTIGTDKKVTQGRVVFVLPRAPGKVELVQVGMETFTAAVLRVFES